MPERIWIDLDNTPHVPFFEPIVRRLRERGHEVVLTARDAYNVRELLGLSQLKAAVIGRHLGKNRAMKLAGTFERAARLAAWASSCKPSLAVSHGSRAQMLAAKVLRVKSVVIADYEHVAHIMRADHAIVPTLIPREVAGRIANDVMTYPGIKEDVYASAFMPDPEFEHVNALPRDKVIVTVRPPATEAHYHTRHSDQLFAATLELLAASAHTHTVLLPRSALQLRDIVRRFGALAQRAGLTVPSGALNGLDLVWHSDLVISGGGTMNREAAALGVPVYSIFGGQIGAVDRWLAAHGRLRLLESASDVTTGIALVKRARLPHRNTRRTAALERVVEHICALAGGGDAGRVAMAAEPGA
jgi:hypothetical protein